MTMCQSHKHRRVQITLHSIGANKDGEKKRFEPSIESVEGNKKILRTIIVRRSDKQNRSEQQLYLARPRRRRSKYTRNRDPKNRCAPTSSTCENTQLFMKNK